MYVNSSKRKEGRRRVNYGGPPLSTLVQCIKHARSACVCVPWPRFSSRNSIYDFGSETAQEAPPFPFPTDQLTHATNRFFSLSSVTPLPPRNYRATAQNTSFFCRYDTNNPTNWPIAAIREIEAWKTRGKIRITLVSLLRGYHEFLRLSDRDSKLRFSESTNLSRLSEILEISTSISSHQTICEILESFVCLERRTKRRSRESETQSLMTQNSFSISTSTAHCCSGIVARMRLSARIAIYDSRRYK